MVTVGPVSQRLVLLTMFLASGGIGIESALAQEATTNPRAGDATAINGGKNVYRGRCGVCHGIDAKGYRGSDLSDGPRA